MDKHEFEIYQQTLIESPVRPTVSVEDLHDLTPRTLLYGYNISGTTGDYEGTATVHVFLGHDGLLHKLVDRPGYATERLIIEHTVSRSFFAEELIPSKRAYPQHTDRTFAVLLAAVGYSVTFTTWDEPRAGYPTPFEKVTAAGLA